MGHYLANFSVYTMAMLGLIFFAVYVYKKFFMGVTGTASAKMLSIEETLPINPRKSLIVVRAGEERFLVASDVDKTTLISKLGANEKVVYPEIFQNNQNIYPRKKVEMNEKVYQQIDDVQVPDKKIHLEPIEPKRRGNRKGTVVLDFSEPKSYGMSSMKEMAKKINEL